eukprot:1883699-Heterocapsa_arctica.AAC.1
MERDVQETRPAKRRRGGQRDSHIEEDSDSFFSHTNEESSEGQSHHDDMMEEDRNVWTKQEIAPADFMEELECQMRTDTKSDTEWVESNTGVGAWRICRNPICYRCDIIDKAEMEL